MSQKQLLFFILILITTSLKSQITDLKPLPDSISAQVDTIESFEKRSNFLMYKSWDFIPDNLDLAYLIVKHSEKIARKNGYLKGIANSKTTLGAIFQLQSDFPRALEYQFDALDIYKNNDDPDFKSSLGAAYNNIGNTYLLAENLEDALKYYNLSYEQRSRDKDTVGAMNTLFNMSAIHLKNEDFETTIKKSTSIIDSMNYFNQESSQKLFTDKEYFNIYSNIIEAYKKSEKPDSALLYIKKAFNYIDTTKNYARYSKIYIDAAITHKTLKNNKKAEYYLSKALNDISQSKINYSTKDKADISEKLYHYFKINKNYRRALEYYEEHFEYNNEQLNKEKNDKIATFNNQIRFKEKENELRLLAAENDLKSEQINAANQVRNILIALAFVIIIFSLILFNKFKVTKKLNHKISEKNKEIFDSIIYAKRIQNAVLPPLKMLNKIFKEIFVFYQPKDVVAGDFYWVHEKDGITFLAVADCTGHGVPGAMVSVIANSALNRSVKEFNLLDPASILNKSREIVIEEFKKSEEDVKDGMDISLVAIHRDKIVFAGANNPLWIVKNKVLSRENMNLRTKDKIFNDHHLNRSLIELYPDKQPIGKYDNARPFNQHSIEKEKDDQIFLFSDGFQDQFGGPKGKKYKRSKFRELILKNSSKPMEEINQRLKSEVKDWMKNADQVDDICIIGVKI